MRTHLACGVALVGCALAMPPALGAQSSAGSPAATQPQGAPSGPPKAGSAADTERGQLPEGHEAGPHGSRASHANDDRAFIVQAAAAGMAEVELGRLATQKAASDEVKRFSQQMVDDHGKANEQLMEIARQKQLMAPHALTPEDQQAYDRLSKLEGEAFDRAYVQHMARDHRNGLRLFRRYAKSASDPKVKQFASAQLPVLERHFDTVKDLQRSIARGTSGRTGSGKPHTAGSDKPGGRPGEESPSGSGSEKPPKE